MATSFQLVGAVYGLRCGNVRANRRVSVPNRERSRPADESVVVTELGVFNGGEVLPGFSLPVGQLFSELDHHAE